MHAMSASLELLREIKQGAKAIGIAPTTLCQRAVKNGGLVHRLSKKQGSVTLETANKIRAYIAKHRPQAEAAE